MPENAHHESLSKEWEEAQKEWEAAHHHHRYIIDKYKTSNPGEGFLETQEAEIRLDKAFQRLQGARDRMV